MMQNTCHFCGTTNPERGLFSMGTTCSKVQRQTTFLHRQTRTERTGQYKGKGLYCRRTSVHAACEGSPESWGQEDKSKTIKNRKVPPHFMNTVVYSVSWYFPSSCGDQDIKCLYCFLSFEESFLESTCISRVFNVSHKDQLRSCCIKENCPLFVVFLVFSY